MSRSDSLTPAVSDQDHAQGSATAAVTLVEYADYQCPYCGEAYATVREVQRRMGDQLRFVFRNFPLAEVHPHAVAAAVFAESAAPEGDFWAAHDWLFEHQDRLDEAGLSDAAGALGLDRRALAQVEPTARQRVVSDVQGGEQSGVQGTPAFFINGLQFQGSWDVPGLLAAVRDASGE